MKSFFNLRQMSFGVLLLLAGWGTANAQSIYKCTHAGRIEYTDHPCPNGNGELLHKAGDSEIIDQYLDLGQNDVAKRYATARHLQALYQSRLEAYNRKMEERSQRAADQASADAVAEQQRDEQAKQQALADNAAARERLQAENDLLRQQNDQYRDQLTQPAAGYVPNYWAPPYVDHGHDHGHGQHPPPPPSPPVIHPCRQIAGGQSQC